MGALLAASHQTAALFLSPGRISCRGPSALQASQVSSHLALQWGGEWAGICSGIC